MSSVVPPRSFVALLLAACVTAGGDSGGPRPRDSGPHAGDTADTADTGTPDDSGGDTAIEGCGDGEVDAAAHEECDAAADDACPGRCASTCQCPSMPASDTLTLLVVDVWQGDGLVLVSPAGFVTVIDSGDTSALDAMEGALTAAGIPGVDHTLVSHQHADHMGAMGQLLDAHPEVGLVWDGGGRAATDAFDRYEAAAGRRRTTVALGDTLDLGPGTLAEVLHADVGDRENENLNSVVLRVTVGTVHLLLGGDCETFGCEDQFEPGPIELYKAHHHGSNDSSGWAFLQAMQPKVALISVGAGNDYGHPKTGTLQAFAALGAEVWRTDESGTLTVTTDGTTWDVSAAGR